MDMEAPRQQAESRSPIRARLDDAGNRAIDLLDIALAALLSTPGLTLAAGACLIGWWLSAG